MHGEELSWCLDLLALSRTATIEKDPQSVQQAILRHITEAFEAASGCLALADADGEHLTIVAGSGLPAKAIGNRIRIGEGILGLVAQQREPLLLNGDISGDPRFRNLPRRTESARPSSSICWPLKIEDRLLGVLSVNRTQGQESYSDGNLEYGRPFVDLLTLVVENAQLHIGQKAQIDLLSGKNEEIRAAYRKLQETQQQLLQSEKMASVGQLAAGVAHEINNPIGYVNSNIGSLSTYIDSLFRLIRAYGGVEESLAGNEHLLHEVRAIKKEIDLEFLFQDTLDLIRESQEGLTRVKQIVQDLKDFSRLNEAEWAWTDLLKGLDSTLNIAHNEIKYKARVVKEYRPLPAVKCQASQINQVFMNLLVNAAQAIEEHGVITLRTDVAGDHVWIEVADTGKGIPAENIGRIFDPFFSTKPVGQGTGLGLSISYGIIQKHKGRIEVQSEVGKGTTFRVTLPISQGQRAAASPTPQAAASQS